MGNDKPDEEEYERHLENLRNAPDTSGEHLGYGFGSQYLSDEMKYTEGIICYEPAKEYEDILKRSYLKKRTTALLTQIYHFAVSKDKVVSNFSNRDIRGEKLGLQLWGATVKGNMSGLEEEVNDGNFQSIATDVTHRTRVTRSREGFERKVQKTNIQRTTQRSILGSDKPDQVKTGISRYMPSRRV